MQIAIFNQSVLAQVTKIILEEGADGRCIKNIQHILNTKLFGRSTPHQEVIPKYMGDVYHRFETELDALIQKCHYPMACREKTLNAFNNIASQIADVSTIYGKPGSVERIEQFKDSLHISQRDFCDESENTKRNTACYETDANGEDLILTLPGSSQKQHVQRTPHANVSHTEVEVVNQDSFEAAHNLIKQGLQHVLVLNLANRFWAGGGVVHGATAQEEDLMRRSNYYFSLAQPSLTTEMMAGTYQKRHKYHQPLPEFGSIYSSSVIVLKECAFTRLAKPFEVSCIAMAGYDLGKPEKLDENERNHLLDSRGDIDLLKFQENTKKKIRHILDVALENGHRHLVLGALSCGAFKFKGDATGLTAQAVATAYREVLEESKYCHKFEKITFAILDGKPTPYSNFAIFSNVLLGLNQPQAINLLSQYPLITDASISSCSPAAAAAAPENVASSDLTQIRETVKEELDVLTNACGERPPSPRN